MPRSTVPQLQQAGYQAVDVRDIGLRGHADREIFAEAQERRAILVSGDKGFSNTIQFPIGTHAGILVVRVPSELSTSQVNHELLRALEDLRGASLDGSLVIVEVGRTRIRRPTS